MRRLHAIEGNGRFFFDLWFVPERVLLQHRQKLTPSERRKMQTVRRLPDSRPEKILVFRALMLGDMLCAVPALRALRHMCPQAEIALIGLPWARAFAARFPKYIDSFIEFPGFPGLPERDWRAAETVEFIRDMQSQKADWIVQLHGDGTIINPLMMLFAASRAAGYYLPDAYCPDAATFLPYPADEPEVRRHLRLMEFLGATDLDEDLEFTITDEDHIPLAALTGGDEWFHQPYVCIHPGVLRKPPLVAAVLRGSRRPHSAGGIPDRHHRLIE